MQNAFIGRPQKPSEQDLPAALGKSYVIWKALVTDLKRDLSLDGEEWNTYSIKAGWSLRLLQKKRKIVYLSPEAGSFLVSLILGDKAIVAARASKMPRHVRDLIGSAKRYVEGTAIRIEVRGPKDVAAVMFLAKIKAEN